MWSSPSSGATGRFVRPAYRTPFGVDGPTIWGRATAARTARHLWPHSTTWQHGLGCQNGCAQLRNALLPSLRPRFARALRKRAPRYRLAETVLVSNNAKDFGLLHNSAKHVDDEAVNKAV